MTAMEFTCKKTENCFSDSQTFEYDLPVTGRELLPLLDGWESRTNERLRRPAFSADRDGVNIKGILVFDVVKVSYPDGGWEAEKERFERWLSNV